MAILRCAQDDWCLFQLSTRLSPCLRASVVKSLPRGAQMPDGTIGAAVQARDAAAVVDRIVELGRMGMPAVWLTTGGTAPDALTVFAAAAARTERVLMGTAITSTYPRHPLVTVQQTLALASLA